MMNLIVGIGVLLIIIAIISFIIGYLFCYNAFRFEVDKLLLKIKSDDDTQNDIPEWEVREWLEELIYK